MMLSDAAGMTKDEVFSRLEAFLAEKGFQIVDRDQARPWGGFLVIDEAQAFDFAKTFFPEQNMESFRHFSKLSPKILMVEPGKRLSWQYHHRRAELWKVIAGSAGVIISETDEQMPVQHLETGSIVELKQGERHRLTGLDEWGVVAEIWKHTDAENPSDENDIIRVEDDFGR
mgnify:CR=1 FL=1